MRYCKYYYYLRYPNDENEWGRGMRVSPLAPRLQELGAVFGEKNGWERVNYFDSGKPPRRAGADQRAWGWNKPAYFDLVGEEHRAARERVALFDMTSFNKIDVRGPGAVRLLQYLADNDIDKPIGSLTYTQFLNTRGGIESDLTITRLGEDYFRVTTGTAFGAQDMGWIQMQAREIRDSEIRDSEIRDLEIRDCTGDFACLGLWGPDARKVLEQVTSDDVSNESFSYVTARHIRINECKVLAQRVSYVGELGWELYIANAEAIKIWDALMMAGKAFGIRPAGYKALDSLRLEKRYRAWGADITPAENPYESGQAFCVKLNKGDGSTGSPQAFIGRDALLKAKERGVKQKLCALTLTPTLQAEEEVVIYGGEAVYADDRVVGRVRSGGYGYTIGKNIAFTYLPLELARVGIVLYVDVHGERVPGVVANDPLYDPRGEKMRA